MANRTEYIEALGGIMRLGAIAVPLNFRLVAAEVAHLLHDSGATLLLVDEDRVDIAVEAVAAAGAMRRSSSWARARRPGPPTDGPIFPMALPTRHHFPRTPWRLGSPPAPAVIMYTSGTTGRPKGAVLTHLNLLMATMAFIAHDTQPCKGGTSLCAAPIFHIAGLAKVVPRSRSARRSC